MIQKILFFLLLAACSLSIFAQAPSKKCPTCGLSIPKCQLRIPVDTRSPIPVISVQSVGDLQYRWQS